MGENFQKELDSNISKLNPVAQLNRDVLLSKNYFYREDIKSKEKIYKYAENLLNTTITEQKNIEEMYQKLHQKEENFSNFLSPENAMGFSTRLTGDKTFTAIKLESLEAINESLMRTIPALKQFLFQIQSPASESEGKSLLRHIPSSIAGLPEGKYLQNLIFGEDASVVEIKYQLDKAIWLKSFDGYGKELAETHFDSLSGSKYSKIAKRESLSTSEKFHSHLTSIANGMLSYDQLVLFAASGGIGTLIAKGVSKSSKAMDIVRAIQEMVSKVPTSITRAVIPGVSVIKKTGTEGRLSSIAKSGANFGADILKFTAIHESAASTGSDVLTKVVDAGLVVLPGATHGYSSEIRKMQALRDARAPTIVENISQKKEYSSFRVKNTEISITREGFTDHDTLKKELLAYLQENPHIKQIRLPQSMPTDGKKIVMDILTENRPLLGVLRIMPEGSVATFVFEGIKRLNDQFGQQTVDEILATFKGKIRAELLLQRGGIGNIRMLSNDYKKMSVSFPKGVNFTILSKERTDELLLETLQEQALLLTRLSKTLNIPIEKVYSEMRMLSVGMGVSRVGKAPKDIDLLEAVYESERGARRGLLKESNITGIESTQRGIKDYALKRSEMIDTFSHVKFEYNGKKYTSVVEMRGKKELHPLLFEIVRKPDYLTTLKPRELAEGVRNLTTKLGKELDYIAPTMDFSKGFEEARKIDQNFRAGIIPRKALETNFKGFTTKPAFYESVRNKEGISIFVDIKAMDRENRALLESMAARFEKGEVPSIVERLDILGPVTRRMLRAVETFKQAHPHMQVAIGGDEMLFFAPGAPAEEGVKYVSQIRDLLARESLNVRVASEYGTSSAQIFDRLDGLTKISKYIEQYAKLPDGSIPLFMRHVEVKGGNFEVEEVLQLLQKNPKLLERAIISIGQSRSQATIPISHQGSIQLVPNEKNTGITVEYVTNELLRKYK